MRERGTEGVREWVDSIKKVDNKLREREFEKRVVEGKPQKSTTNFQMRIQSGGDTYVEEC